MTNRVELALEELWFHAAHVWSRHWISATALIASGDAIDFATIAWSRRMTDDESSQFFQGYEARLLSEYTKSRFVN